MILLDDIKNQLNNVLKKLAYLRDSVGYDNLLTQIEHLEKLTEGVDFWKDIANSKKVLQNIKVLKKMCKDLDDIKNIIDDVSALIEISIEDNDESMIKEIEDSFKTAVDMIEEKEIEVILDDEYDKNDAIVTIHSGAGGTESQDWVSMIYRMYTKFCNREGYDLKVIDFLDGEETGYKSVSFSVSGLYAYGYLKSENGVHRLVRISPFDSSGRRHTSFASVEVLPEIDEDIDITINSEDLKIDTFRASGAGGQHVNKTESAVRVTHIPTGIIVSCQNQRSQHQNKYTALKILKSKLVSIKEKENLEKIADIKGFQKENGFSSQIRSYVFMPYTIVKDHRTSFEKGNVNAVMDGDIKEFIHEYLKQKNLKLI